MDDTEIKELIKNINAQCSDGSYIFRGTSKIHSTEKDGINSTLYRKYGNPEEMWTERFRPVDVEREIVRMLRNRQKDYARCTNIEILTDLRHYGARVALIDFTRDIYSALFFACNGNFEEDGELIMLSRFGISHIDDVDYGNPIFSVINPAPTKDGYKRVMSQNSIFVYAPDGFIHKSMLRILTISSRDKKGILNYLKYHHNISQNSIYNDLLGFIYNEENYTSSRAKFDEGLLYHGNGDLDKAIKAYSYAIELDPNLVEAYAGRGGAKVGTGDFTGAIEDCTKAIEVNPGMANAYLVRGIAKHGMSEYRGAIKEYNKAIELDSNLADGIFYLNRARAKRMMEDFRGSIEDFDKAIELNQKFTEAYAESGFTKYLAKDHEGAIEYCNKAIELDSNFPDPYFIRASAKGEMGDFEGALVDSDKAIELNPEFAEAYVCRGTAKNKIGDIDGAVQDWERAIGIDLNWEEPLVTPINDLKEKIKRAAKDGGRAK